MRSWSSCWPACTAVTPRLNTFAIMLFMLSCQNLDNRARSFRVKAPATRYFGLRGIGHQHRLAPGLSITFEVNLTRQTLFLCINASICYTATTAAASTCTARYQQSSNCTQQTSNCSQTRTHPACRAGLMQCCFKVSSSLHEKSKYAKQLLRLPTCTGGVQWQALGQLDWSGVP